MARTKNDKHPASGPKPSASGRPLGLADLEWLGQAACNEFFKLHDNEVFRGIGAGAVLLPPHSVPASRSPNSGGAVIEAFPHGLAYGSMMTVLVGYLAFGAIAIMSPLLALLIPTLFTSFDAFSAVFGGIMLLATMFMLRFDLIGYRYAPTLFDRNAGKVHVFKDNTHLFGWWPLWGGGGQHEILSYDWACVRAQVVRFKTFTGTVAQDNAALQMIVLAAPGDTRVVGQFGLGLTSSAIAVQPLLNTWEHIRRFMEHEGPLFVEGDGPNEALFEMRLARCIFFGQPFIGPGSAEHWRHPDLGAILWQVIAIPLFPLTLLYGLIRWASFHIKSKPAWPPEVLASVGGAPLHGSALEAWRHVVPDRAAGAASRLPASASASGATAHRE
ncbi:hypothetical protein NB699_003511 [Xanthomonas sacchari]|uniref:DUF6708 domain-containing protein n=1 Tax=Xanthomonas sacchari TaxID=56458 RepID=UPI0022564F64|nr:DUF6708 domain-containing protein [Xanthomonas sacchari]MCW0368528.1 hypothetical protein [Xanthomonas sacchari]MCW0442671.1 hypothetical protein [Xanthomonas sacchari]